MYPALCLQCWLVLWPAPALGELATLGLSGIHLPVRGPCLAWIWALRSQKPLRTWRRIGWSDLAQAIHTMHRPASSTRCHDAARRLVAWRCSKDAASLATSTQESRIESLFRADAATSEREDSISLSKVLELALVTGQLVRIHVVGVEGLALGAIEMALQRATCPRLSRA